MIMVYSCNLIMKLFKGTHHGKGKIFFDLCFRFFLIFLNFNKRHYFLVEFRFLYINLAQNIKTQLFFIVVLCSCFINKIFLVECLFS